MRDFTIAAIVFGGLPFILAKPHVGILIWSWLSYMNPHRLAWGFAYDFPFAKVIAVALIVSLVFTREPKRVPMTWLTITWLTFILWMGITTFNAWFPEAAHTHYVKVLKIQLITFLTLVVMGSKERLNTLVWVIVLSIGFFGVKGGIFTVMTGGGMRVWGPPESYIADNNSLALALLMILPLMRYLQIVSTDKWIRRGLTGAMMLCAFSIVGSQSRGALLGGVSMVLWLWIKSPRKLLTGTGLVTLMVFLFAFMPATWHDRMETIRTYEKDGSAMGRINAWAYSVQIASDRLTGGGFESWSLETFQLYAPDPNDMHAAHSIYFGVLGDHGWIGLALFLCIGFMAWRTGTWIVRHSRGHDELNWLSHLAKMVQVSLVAYGTGGAFLSMSYFDLPWHLVAILVLGKLIVQKHVKEVIQASYSPLCDSTTGAGDRGSGDSPQKARAYEKCVG